MINYLLLSAAITSLFFLMILLDSKIIGGLILLMLGIKIIMFPVYSVIEGLTPFVFMFVMYVVHKLLGKHVYFQNSKNSKRIGIGKFRLEVAKKLSLLTLFALDIDDEGDITIAYWLGVNIYFSYENRALSKFIAKQKYSLSWTWFPERELRVAVHGGRIWFNFWDNERGERSCNFNLLFFLGKEVHEKSIQGLVVHEICFPEGKYLLLEKKWKVFSGCSNLKWYYKLFGKKWLKIPEVSCVKLKEELSLHEVQYILDSWVINYNNDWLSKNLDEELEYLFEDRYVPNGSTKYGTDGGTHSIWFGNQAQSKGYYFDAAFEFYMNVMKERIKYQGYCWTPKTDEDNG